MEALRVHMYSGMSANALNLEATYLSGQPITFHAVYSKAEGIESLAYATGKGAIFIEGTGSESAKSLRFGYVGAYGKAEAAREIKKRFGIDDDMHGIYKGIETDMFISEAISRMYGLRVTQSDPWETTLCFIISQFNNIKRIRGIVLNLRRRYGEEFDFKGHKMRLFPAPEALSAAEAEGLRACGAGFRARYIKKAAKECSEGALDGIYDMEYDEAKKHLMQLDGIGDKVADCILLFGYKRYEAFPIDVWIKRIMEKRYMGKNASISEIRSFAHSRWKGLAGYAHEYIYAYGRQKRIGVLE